MARSNPDEIVSGAALRAPLAPFDLVLRWTEGLSASADPHAAAAEDLASDRALLGARLRAAYDDPVLREAVQLASPGVFAPLERWRTDGAELGPRVERTLVSYLLRAGGRCTPFGLFAGCGRVELGSETSLDLTGARVQRRSRLDFGYLDALTDALAARADVRSRLVVQPNSTLYPAGGRLRYAVSTVSGGARNHHLAATDPTPAVSVALRLAAGGARVDKLAAELSTELADLGVTEQQAFDFLTAMLDEQLLVPIAGPPVTGDPAPDAVLDGMPDVPSVAAARSALAAVTATLRELDELPPGQPPEPYHRVVDALRPLPTPVDPARLVQVDAGLRADGVVLGPAVVRAVQAAAELIIRIGGPADPEADTLARFRDAFNDRYESRFVPLLEALDAEAGIGYPAGLSPADDSSPLVAGLPLPRPSVSPTWTRRDDVLLRLLAGALRRGETELRLSERDVRELGTSNRVPPAAYHVMATVCAADAADVDAGEFTLLVRSVNGPSGVSLLGRFCHLTTELRLLVDAQVAAEERLQPGRAFAELVHLPEGRTGNILARPVLRRWEIPFLGRSGAPAGRQLPLADLSVGVVDGRVVLRSARLDAEVVPRLTTAHNYSVHSLAVYRFLCDLQFQDAAADLDWTWGPLAAAPFLPRVVFGRTVLARARWRVEPAEATALRRPGEPAARYRGVQAWRRRVGAPRWVVLADGDNELVVDLDNVLCVDVLLAGLHPDRHTDLLELFPAPEHMCLRGPAGRYVHELVVPIVTASPEPASGDARTGRPAEAAKSRAGSRRFTPGSDWLYVRLYGGEASADEVLLGTVGPLTSMARDAGLVRRWFFLRYADPEPHLRVRWYGRPADLTGELLPSLQAALEPLLDDGLLWRVDLGTYEREVERYGGPAGIELAEEIFDADSGFVLDALGSLDGADAPELRWRLALAGTDRLLADLRLPLDERRRWAAHTRRALLAENGAGAGLTRELGVRFRPRGAELADLLNGAAAAGSAMADGLHALDRRSTALAPIIDRLWRLHGEAALTEPVTELAHSYVHMHVNRMIRSGQRATEMVLADWLERLYRGAEARGQR
jgi:thiopeptide-type bacteriocin biosynthesis protein